MKHILCSTGALIGRPNGRDWRLLEKFTPRLKFDGYEFMVYDSWYERLSEVVRDVARMGLNIPTLHCEKTLGELLSVREYAEAERQFRLNCEAAAALGARLLVLHLWNGRISDSHIDNNIEGAKRLEPIAESFGLRLTVENVVCNCRDPMCHIDRLAAETDVCFTFDTKMAAFHRQLDDVFAPERACLWRDRRIRHIHINDYAGGYMDWSNLRTLHPGQGNIDFAEFFSRLKAMSYTGDYTIEATSFDQSGEVDLDALNRDYEYVRDCLAR